MRRDRANAHLFEDARGWGFFDEAGLDSGYRGGTRLEAEVAFREYCEHLNGGAEDDNAPVEI